MLKNHANDCHGNHELFPSATKFIIEDIFFFLHFWVPINDLAPMKDCPGVQGRSN